MNVKEFFRKGFENIVFITLMYIVYTLILVILLSILYDVMNVILYILGSTIAIWIFFIISIIYRENLKKKLKEKENE